LEVVLAVEEDLLGGATANGFAVVLFEEAVVEDVAVV
jgi:hypothetical protein